MKLGTLDIIGDPADFGHALKLTIAVGDVKTNATLSSEQTEHLITYLKGLRDGLGWNKKAAADRSR